MRARANGIELEYETFGTSGSPPVVLVAGFSQQLTAWDPRLCAAIAARGLFVVRFDNRDVGLSTKIDAPKPKLPAIVAGDRSTMAYGLEDMAEDLAGLVDALALGPAHVVGVSMGGMIAQTLAIRHAAKVRSLVSVMSTPGDPRVGQPTPETFALVMQRLPREREENIAHALRVWRQIRSPAFEHDEGQMRAQMGRNFDRAFSPEGVARQAAAIVGQVDRTAALAGVRVPTTVLHGADDTLIHASGGEATARAIPGSRLVVVPGMGHDLPAGVWSILVDAIAAQATRAG